MQIGDNVRVRAPGRRGRIIEDHGQSRYRVLFYSEPPVDPLDTTTIDDEDDAAGVLRSQRSRSHSLIVNIFNAKANGRPAGGPEFSARSRSTPGDSGQLEDKSWTILNFG
jgi:hypothetical protein